MLLSAAAAAAEPLPVDVFFLPGCRDCAAFEADALPRAVRLLEDGGIGVELRFRDVMAAEGYEYLIAEATARSRDFKGVPLVLAAGTFFDGADLEPERLAAGIAAAARAGSVPSGASAGTPSAPAAPAPTGASASSAPPTSGIDLALPAVLGAGLVDGVNPCAIAGLLFLVSAFALAGRRRSVVLATGAGFIAGVFSAYFLTGLGLLKAGSLLAAFPFAAAALRVLAVGSLLVLAAFSVRDALLARAGRTADMALKLPAPLVKLSHRLVRAGSSFGAGLAGSFVLGALVSMVEFVCTGQVYLPTLVYVARAGAARGVLLLAVYNLGFILPLAAVFAAVAAGTSHARLAAFFRARVFASKLALAAVFAALAMLLTLA